MEALRATLPKGGFFRIKLLRSAIGLPRRYRGVLEALGLKRRLAVVYQPVTRDIAGMIMKIKELVDVEEVDDRKTKEEMAVERRPETGYVVERRIRNSPMGPWRAKIVQTATWESRTTGRTKTVKKELADDTRSDTVNIS